MTKKLPMFTYGILKPEIGAMRHYIPVDKVRGEYTSVPDYCICDVGIALAYYRPGEHVEGYLWHMEDLPDDQYAMALAAIDRLEASYTRVEVRTEEGVSAWMYVVNQHGIEECGCHSKWPTRGWEDYYGKDEI